MSATPRAIIGLIAAAALASVSTLALSTAVSAQPAPNGQAPTAEQHAEWKAKFEARRQEHMEMHAKHLHDLLQLRPDQDAALHTLLTSLAPPMDHMDHMGDHHMGPGHEGPGAGPDGPDAHDEFAKLTTPERLDKMSAMMTEHIAKRQQAFQKHATAIKAFYAVLSPAQQHAFDALPPEMLGGMHDHHEGEGHGPGGFHMGPPGGPHGLGGPDAPPPPQ